MLAWIRLVLLSAVVATVVVYLAAWLSKAGEPVKQAAESQLSVKEASPIHPEPTQPSAPRQDTEPARPPDLPRFEKLDSLGQVLPDSVEAWDCVRDNENGLVWEVKQNNGGLRDLDFTYSWYASDGNVGVTDGGKCYYVFCDTESLVEAVNEEGLCGWRDWRLPTNLELMTLDTERLFYDPDIDQRYFPNTRSGYYWTSTKAEVGPLSWSINFLNGFPEVSPRRLAYHVRLVRSD